MSGNGLSGPAWSPDGRLLAYERREVQNGRRNLGLQACRIWLPDLEDWEERLLFDQDVPLYAPVRSCFTTFST